MTTKFPLGVYVGNPNGSDPTAEAWFETQFNNFVATMGGAVPTTMNAFVNFTADPSTWAGTASWTAWSWAQSPVVGTKMTPIIGIPMSDNQHWASSAAGSTNDDFFKGIINGSYDADYKGIVDGWANNGFKTMEFRLGWEMNGDFMPWYQGSSAAVQADWVKAFQHLSTLMRSEAQADGVSAKIIWNPGSMGTTTLPTIAAYPGDQYVDVISLDSYSHLYPGGYYDWAKNDGSYDATLQQWEANPVNKDHFWSYPDAVNQLAPTGTNNGFGMEDAIAFAKAHGKALALSETGAGGDGNLLGPVDEPDFPAWLAGELAKAQAEGVTIDHVNIWDTVQSDGNWSFQPGAGKPLEAAAWGQYFGAASGTATTTAPAATATTAAAAATATAAANAAASVTAAASATAAAAATAAASVASTAAATALAAATTIVAATAPATTTVAAAASPSTLVLSMSEDAYLGDAQFTVSVDGVQQGGVQTVTASHSAGASQAFTFAGSWTGSHVVAVNFLNDLWGGSASADRNLYVGSISLNGVNNPNTTLEIGANGSVPFTVSDVPAAKTGSSTLVLNLSEDAYLGNAQFIVSVDGVQQGGVQTVTALHATGATQAFGFNGSWTGSHSVAVSFLNDAWGGTASTDRNLYVNSISLNGVSNSGTTLELAQTGTSVFRVADSTSVSKSLVLHLSEDAYQGDAQFTVSVDGTQQGGVQTVTASHTAGASQAFTIGSFASGSHTVSVNFLNDAWGGNATVDRNLYVDSMDFGGVSNLGANKELASNGAQSFTVTDTQATADAAAINQTVVANLSEDAWGGDAQFLITVDGKAVSTATSVTTSHASGLSQAFAYTGQFGVGPHDIGISFINDAWGGTSTTDRNLYVNSLDFNGHHYAADTASLMSNGTQHFQVGVAGQL